jgi:ubiquinone/menaquinone biosynthesis C-methylase UbiE
MKNISIIVQASSTSWSGGKDLCMNRMDGKPVLYHTIKELVEYFNEDIANLWLAAPEFDRGGLEFVRDLFPSAVLRTYYGYDASPLQRMIAVTQSLKDEDFVLRANGINFCVDTVSAKENLRLAQASSYDCVRFPDNFPALFTSDVYRVGALRQMHAGDEGVDKKYYIHPKYYLSKSPNYKCAISEPDRSRYSDEYLSSVRQRYKNAMAAKRIEVDTSKAIKSGDSIQLHYELASTFLKGSGFVLDLACGSGFGTKMLSADAGRVVGVDNDREIIDQARNVYRASGLDFLAADVLNLPYESNSVDAVVAFEIIEHVPPNDLLTEINRVLKPGGVMCLSTPQNSLGHIPATSDHLREFSLEEIRAIVGELFLLETIIGIKQGSIFFTGDPVGSNTFIVAKKRRGNDAAAQ